MAILRLERQEGNFGTLPQYDGICESVDDVTEMESDGYASFNGSHIALGAGSLIFCMGDGKLYVKLSDGTWGAAV